MAKTRKTFTAIHGRWKSCSGGVKFLSRGNQKICRAKKPDLRIHTLPRLGSQSLKAVMARSIQKMNGSFIWPC
ncbi:hypothetical protein WK03_07620 [Burkholderia cepacia]|nr:hypothetical protein WK03_07620 [Burkholderia cepacia]